MQRGVGVQQHFIRISVPTFQSLTQEQENKRNDAITLLKTHTDKKIRRRDESDSEEQDDVLDRNSTVLKNNIIIQFPRELNIYAG